MPKSSLPKRPGKSLSTAASAAMIPQNHPLDSLKTQYFRALMEGSVARSAMLELFDINIEAAEPGLVVLTAIPTTDHYNPLGFVHGGYAAVLLDTCMAAAIVTSLEAGLSS